jgi:tetratricopeptide (TPR) repeat protein
MNATAVEDLSGKLKSIQVENLTAGINTSQVEDSSASNTTLTIQQIQKEIGLLSRKIFKTNNQQLLLTRSNWFAKIGDLASAVIYSSDHQYLYAQILLDQKRYQEALDCLEKCKLDHSIIGTRIVLAHLGLGNIDQAIQHLFLLLSNKKDDIELYILRARLYYHQQKIFFAQADLQVNPSHNIDS